MSTSSALMSSFSSPIAPFLVHWPPLWLCSFHACTLYMYLLPLMLIFSDVFASYFVSLNEGPSALHRQVTVTVHVDAVSARTAGLGSCASSPGRVTWATVNTMNSVRHQMESFAAEKVNVIFGSLHFSREWENVETSYLSRCSMSTTSSRVSKFIFNHILEKTKALRWVLSCAVSPRQLGKAPAPPATLLLVTVVENGEDEWNSILQWIINLCIILCLGPCLLGPVAIITLPVDQHIEHTSSVYWWI